MFERDGAKNAANFAKHGVDFELARRIFDGPVLTLTDMRMDYGERREIGMVDGVVILIVVHTDRQGHVRIISARRASRRERRRYEEAP